MFSTIGKKAVAVCGLVTVLAVGGIAYAYFTSSGSGTGSGTVGASSAVVITQTNTVGPLFPGSAAQLIDLNVNNPGGGAQYVGTVTVTVASVFNQANDTDISSTCLPAWFTTTDGVIDASVSAGPTHAYPGSATAASVRLTDSGTNQDVCQNANVHLAFASN